MVTEDVNGAELVVGAVPELEPQELTGVGRGAAKLDGERRTKIGC